MAAATASRQTISLKGSTAIVSEFFAYAVNSILFQRGVYPPEAFASVKKYGLSMMVAKDAELATYIDAVLAQIGTWLGSGNLQKLVLVVTSSVTQEVLERWAFDIHAEGAAAGSSSERPEKSEKEVMGEIQAIIRQITASVTFLPLLEDPCTFELLVYADKDSDVPGEWEDSGPRFIAHQAEVRLRSFNTKVHRVDALVAYREPE